MATPQQNALTAWLASKAQLSPSPSDTTRLNLLAARTAVVPQRDTAALAASLQSFFETVVALVGSTPPAQHRAAAEVLAGYIADTRQPAWARLAAALLAGDPDAVSALAGHVDALQATPGLRSIPADPTAFAMLAPEDRVSLAATHLVSFPGRHLTPSELGRAVAGATASTTRASLAAQIDWSGVTDVFSVLTPAITGLLGRWITRQLVCDWACQTAALDHPQPGTVSTLAELFEDGSESYPGLDGIRYSLATLRITTNLDDNAFTQLTSELLAGTRGRRRLAAILVASRPRPPATLIGSLAASPDTVFALPGLAHYADNTTLAATITTLATTLPDNPFPRLELLSRLVSSTTGVSTALELYPTLGELADLVVAATADRLARSHGYTHTREDAALFAALPPSLSARLLSVTPADVQVLLPERDSSHLTTMIRDTFVVGHDTLDSARSVLYELGYTPPPGRTAPFSHLLVTALRSGLLDEYRHSADAALTERNRAWLNLLTAPDVLSLVHHSVAYNQRCAQATSLSPSLRSLLDDAYSAACDPAARACLLEVLAQPSYSHALPQKQTLVEYAASLHQVVTRT